MSQAGVSGVFEPVEIAVKNYRNYVEETFNFNNISFCTINGQNGAGKSSLFMDAIVDCLYEKTREDDNALSAIKFNADYMLSVQSECEELLVS